MDGSVKAEHWARLEELFHQASELEGSRRDEFLRTACRNDGELRAELDALLASADKTLDTLKRPVDEAARQITFIGRRIGPYIIQRLLE